MSSLLKHYDQEYYRSHYGAFMDDNDYMRAISMFYKYAIFDGLNLSAQDRILDFGSGLGQLTLAIDADCYDPSDVIQKYLKLHRKMFSNLEEIPKETYRAVFSSHALEHSLHPAEELREIYTLLEEAGLLILVLPRETIPGKPASVPDNDRHCYAWNFQVLTNLLSATGYRVICQRIFTSPYALRTLARRISVSKAVIWSYHLGRLIRNYPSLLTIAQKI